MGNLYDPPSALREPGSTSKILGKRRRNHDNQPTKTWTYRIRGIPLKWSRSELKQFLETNGNPSAQGLKVKSLAIDIDGNRQIATVDCPKSVELPLTTSGTLETSSTSGPSFATLTCDRHFHGLTTLFFPPEKDHSVDIVAVCGLGGHAFGSFKSKIDDYMWLRDSLGQSVCAADSKKPMARVMTYGYGSTLYNGDDFQHIGDLATALHQHLSTVKLKRPIVLIGHSLGGLIIKEAVIALGRSTLPDYQMLLQRLVGFAFFGVPNTGMHIESLLPMVGQGPNLGMLTDICHHSSHVLDTQRALFGPALAKVKSEVFCFYEMKRSPTARKVDGEWEMSGPEEFLVNKQSATHYKEGVRELEHVLPISATHSNLVKFERNDDSVPKAKLGDICRRAVAPLAQNIQRAEVSKDTLDRRKRLMESLKFPQIGERLDTVKDAHEDTNKWILHHKTFQHWKKLTAIPESHRFIWIKGNAGTGKSTLMKFTYDNIRKSAAEKSTSTFVNAFFFNARGVDLEKTVLGMYRSLVWELLERFPDLQTVFEDEGLLGRNRQTYTSIANLKKLLRGAVQLLGQRSLFWFIDALDECDPGEIGDMVLYFEELVAATLKDGVTLAICFSSRYHPAIPMERAVDLELENSQDHDRDLEHYVGSRLKVHDDAIIREVIRKASGNFLWLKIVVDILSQKYAAGGIEVERKLEEVPGQLANLFNDLLGQKTGDKVENEATKLTMLWLLFSYRPLSPVELQNAIWGGLRAKGLLHPESLPLMHSLPGAIKRASQYVVESSKGLALVTKGGPWRTVQLMHESVRDHLLKEDTLAKLWPELTTPQFQADIVGLSHTTLRQSCMEYFGYCLNAASRMSSVKSTSDGRFLDYTVDHVLDHAEAAAGVCPQTEFISTFPLSDYISARKSPKFWSPRLYGENADLLYVLSYEGHAKLIRAFLQLEDVGHRTAERTGRHKFPALAAAANGHQEALNVLLSSQADIYVGADLFHGLELETVASGSSRPRQTYYRYTPLSWAASRGYTQMVSKLIGYQQPINEPDLSETPLCVAATYGSEAIVRLLIEKGADINADNPLVQALIHGHEAIARLLIQEGADVNAGNPLQQASIYGHEAIVRLLIQEGADVNAGKPLQKASIYGYEAIARLLIEKGADVNAGNPLQKALIYGYEAIARLLIEKGADIIATDGLGGTAMRELLDKGTPI